MKFIISICVWLSPLLCCAQTIQHKDQPAVQNPVLDDPAPDAPRRLPANGIYAGTTSQIPICTRQYVGHESLGNRCAKRQPVPVPHRQVQSHQRIGLGISRRCQQPNDPLLRICIPRQLRPHAQVTRNKNQPTTPTRQNRGRFRPMRKDPRTGSRISPYPDIGGQSWHKNSAPNPPKSSTPITHGFSLCLSAMHWLGNGSAAVPFHRSQCIR